MRNINEANNPSTLHGCFTEDGKKHVFQCISKVMPLETCCKAMDMDLRVTYDLSQNVDFNELMTCMDAVEDSLKRWFNSSVMEASSDVFECHGKLSTLGSSPHTLEFDTRMEMNPGWKKHAKEVNLDEEKKYFNASIIGLKEFLVCTRMTDSERNEMERMRDELCPTFFMDGQDGIRSERFQKFTQWLSSRERLSSLPVLQESMNKSIARLMTCTSSADEKILLVPA